MDDTIRNSLVNDMDVAAQVDAAASRLLDEREFHALYGRTAGPLRAYVIRSLGTRDHADDIVQDTFLRVLRKPVPVHDEDELRAYVFRIASNLVVDYWRSHRRESGAELPELSSSPDQSTRLDVGRMFNRLKPRERQMLWLAHVEGASHKEIAAALGLSSASIRVLLSRTRGRLAHLLRDRRKEQG